MLSSIMCDNIEKYYANFFFEPKSNTFSCRNVNDGYINRFNPRHICMPVPIHGMDFQRHMSWPYLCPRM